MRAKMCNPSMSNPSTSIQRKTPSKKKKKKLKISFVFDDVKPHQGRALWIHPQAQGVYHGYTTPPVNYFKLF